VNRAKTPRPRGRPSIPKEVQRRRLIAAALHAFEKNRYEQTRVADIVAEAGMSSRSFYEFFRSKEDLVVELVHIGGRAFLKNLGEVFATTDDPVERVRLGLEAYLGLFSGAPLDLDRLGHEAGLRVAEARRTYVRQISAMIAREVGVAHAAGLAGEPPDLLSIELVITGIEGVSLRYFAEGRSRELFEQLPRLHTLLARAFLLGPQAGSVASR
jgi:AcrR family transcriptional regulator